MGHKLRALVAAACAGCGGAGAPGADAGPPPTIEIGSSVAGFEPLLDGTTIATYHGPQGGFHVYLALRATGVSPGVRSENPRVCTEPGRFQNPCVDFDVFDLDAGRQLDSFVALRMPLTESAPGVFDLAPPRLITLAIPSLDAVDGHRFRVTADIDDASGRTAAAELTVTCAPVR